MADAVDRERRRLAARDAVVLALIVLAIVGAVTVAALYGDGDYLGPLPATLSDRAATFGRVEFLGWFVLGALLGAAGILGAVTLALVVRGRRVVEDRRPRVAA